MTATRLTFRTRMLFAATGLASSLALATAAIPAGASPVTTRSTTAGTATATMPVPAASTTPNATPSSGATSSGEFSLAAAIAAQASDPTADRLIDGQIRIAARGQTAVIPLTARYDGQARTMQLTMDLSGVAAMAAMAEGSTSFTLPPLPSGSTPATAAPTAPTTTPAASGTLPGGIPSKIEMIIDQPNGKLYLPAALLRSEHLTTPFGVVDIAGSSLGSMSGQVASIPGASSITKDLADKALDKGHETVDGVDTVHYTMTLNLGQLIKDNPTLTSNPVLASNPVLTGSMGGMLGAMNMDYDVWVSQDNQVRQVGVTIDVMAIKVDALLRMPAVTSDIVVALPTADQVTAVSMSGIPGLSVLSSADTSDTVVTTMATVTMATVTPITSAVVPVPVTEGPVVTTPATPGT